jgi:homogentisate 1,2-dioxygenase
MPHCYSLGLVPHKRHTQFRRPGGGLYSEQLFSTKGFSTDYSLLYHVHLPAGIIKTGKPVNMQPQVPDEKILRHRSFEGLKIAPAPNCLQSLGRYWQTAICTFAAPQQRQKAYFYKNADSRPTDIYTRRLRHFKNGIRKYCFWVWRLPSFSAWHYLPDAF